MKRSILLMLVLSVPLGLMLVRYASNREEVRKDEGQSHAAPLERTGGSPVVQVGAERTAQSGREQDGAAKQPQSEHDSDRGESHSVVRQSVPQQTRADATTPTTAIAPEKAAVQPTGQSIDTSFVGQPFPVSESIVEFCKEGNPVYRSDCDRLNELLIEFAREPRDEAWATAIEGQLRAKTEEQSENPTIRALECRQTICFIEIASIVYGVTLGDYVFLASDHGLRLEHSVDAHETDAGLRWHISLLPFTRKGRAR